MVLLGTRIDLVRCLYQVLMLLEVEKQGSSPQICACVCKLSGRTVRFSAQIAQYTGGS
jgi:hypothetical protein